MTSRATTPNSQLKKAPAGKKPIAPSPVPSASQPVKPAKHRKPNVLSQAQRVREPKPTAQLEPGPKGGRGVGTKNVLSEAKLKWMNLTGQSPLDFLTAVYRNQLYSEYDVEVYDEQKGLARVYPRLDPVTGELDCKHLPVELDRRISAATAAAPYVHRKKPIGIDGGEGKGLAFVSVDQLAKLSDEQLGKMLEIMGQLGIGAEFAGGEQAPLPSPDGEGE